MASRTSPWGKDLSPGQVAGQRAGQAKVTGRSEAEKPRSEADQTPKKPDQVPVTSGKLLPDLDGRSSWNRRARTIARALASDLGGQDEISTAERILIRKVATLEVQLAMIEQRMALGEGTATHTDLDLYARGLGHLRRTLETLNKRLARCARDVTPKSPLDVLMEFEGPDAEDSQ
jgi:hypothetical protein